MGIIQNTRKPEGVAGKFVLKTMNLGHAKVSKWAFTQIDFNGKENVLDIGCGGGANLLRLLERCKDGLVYGIDYSDQSVQVSQKTVGDELGKRCDIRQGNVVELPYKAETFDVVTAFETVYFWPDLQKCFHGINKVLKRGGRFLVCCECSDPRNTTWTSKIDGMSVYDLKTIKSYMENSGFDIVTANQKENTEWICVIGQKK